MKKSISFWLTVVVTLVVAIIILCMVSYWWIPTVIVVMAACFLWRRSRRAAFALIIFAVFVALITWGASLTISRLSGSQKPPVAASTSASTASQENASEAKTKKAGLAHHENEEKGPAEKTEKSACSAIPGQQATEDCSKPLPRENAEEQKAPGPKEKEPKQVSNDTNHAPLSPAPTPPEAKLVSPNSGSGYDVDVSMEATCGKGKPGYLSCVGYVTNNTNQSKQVTLYDSGATYDHGNHYDIYTFGGGLRFKNGDSASVDPGTSAKFTVMVPAESAPLLTLHVNLEYAGSGGLAEYVFSKDSSLRVP